MSATTSTKHRQTEKRYFAQFNGEKEAFSYCRRLLLMKINHFVSTEEIAQSQQQEVIVLVR